MSDPILPLQEWPEGIAQASVPANENSLRNEALRRPCLGTENNVSTPADGDLYIVGPSPTGSFSTFNPNDLAFARVSDNGTSWHAWAPTDGLRVWLDDNSELVYIGGSTSDWVAGGGGTGSGDVVGPASATDSAVALFDGTTGKLLKNGAVTVNQLKTQSFLIACSDETTALTTGTAKGTFRMPYAFTLTAVRASLTTSQASGSIFTVDINESGTTILSTKITIDNTELTSTTAATPPVISDTALADDASITVDIDQIGTSGAAGLKVTLIGYPT